MASSSSSSTPTPENARNQSAEGGAVVPPMEERLWSFWQKNAKTLFAIAALVLLAIVGQGAWELLQEKNERDIQQAYAAATTTAQLKTFVSANPKHELAGVAQLRIADEAYGDGRYSEAGTIYEQAAGALPAGALKSRARLGAAMAKHQAGQAAEALTALKAIANDANEIKAYRAEAIAHLASLAAAAGNGADVKAHADQLMQLDPASPWTQRTLQLLSSVPASAEADAAAPAAPAAGESPAITLPGEKK